MALSDADYVLRLLLAAGCGGLIGLERQYRSRTAGLRTQALVAVGAASFVLFGVQAGLQAAPLQIAAYVVSGVGFLGGGVILRQGFSVQGLNTAATLWCSAAVGCQAGGGHVVPAITTAAVVLVAHVALRPLGRLVDRIPAARAEQIGAYRVTVHVLEAEETAVRSMLSDLLDAPGLLLHQMTRTNDGGGDTRVTLLDAELLVEGNAPVILDGVIGALNRVSGVVELAWSAAEAPHSTDGAVPVRRMPRLTRRRRRST